MIKTLTIFLTSDADWDTYVGRFGTEIVKMGIVDHFQKIDYGQGIKKIIILLLCRDPIFEFKPIINFTKKDKTLGMDIMFDFELMKTISMEERKAIIAQKLHDEVPVIVRKYKKIEDFDHERFIKDFQQWIVNLGWIP